MSFRGDDQRYGHVPPVQYPVANKPHQQYQQQPQPQQLQQQQYPSPPPAQSQYNQSPYPTRRPSFNTGDDNSYLNQNEATQYQDQSHHQMPPVPSQNNGPPVLPPVFTPTTTQRLDDELFLSPTATEGRIFAPPPIPKKPVAYGGGPVAAGNSPQPQYQVQPSPSTYNPQVFGRSQSQSLPFRPAPAARLTSPTLPSIASFQAQQQQPQNYTPAAYNPAAYAPAEASQPQRSSTLAYAGYQHGYGATVVPQQHTVYPPTPVLAQQSPVPSAQSPQRLYQPQTPQTQQQSYQPSSYYATPSTTGASPQLPVRHDSRLGSTYADGTYSAPPQTTAATAPPSQTSILPPPPTASQAPYPDYTHTTATPGYVPAVDPNSFAGRAERSNSATSQAHSVSPTAGLRRHPTNAPLPSRPPMHDAPLQNPEWLPNDMAADNHLTQESLIQDIEADLGISNNYPTTSDANSAHHMPPMPNNGFIPSADLSRHGSLASATSPGWSSATSGVGRTPSTATTTSGFDYDIRPHGTVPSPYRPEEDSDPEAALGLWEMQQADLDEQRFSLSGPSGAPETTMGAVSTPNPYIYTAQQGQVSPGLRTGIPLSPASEDDPEFVGMDIGLVSGGYAGTVSYGNDVGTAPLQISGGEGGYGQQSTTPRPYDGNRSQQYAPFLDAEMDYGGTGGLQPPVVHRLSFDDGDEQVSLHSGRSGSESPTKDDFLPDMFYHPGLSSRPLPALPPGPTRSGSNNNNMLSAAHSNASSASYQHGYSLGTDSRTSTYYSQHEQHNQLHAPNQPPVERSSSMSSPSTAPIVHLPGRSRTDAAEERRKIQRQQALSSQNGGSSPYGSSYDGSSTVAAPFDGITLPGGRRKRFVPSKLIFADFDRCTMPWALSDLANWVRDMAEGEQDLKRKTIEEGFVVLFTAKVPNMNVADAETLAAMVADSMFAANILLPDEEWVKFGPGSMSGVLWQLTGSGCYAPRVHDPESSGRCYSYHCTRTLKKANLNEILAEKSIEKDWVRFYNITKEMMESKPPKEIERQNVMHEIVTGEEEFSGQLDVLRVLYRDRLLHSQPPVISPNRLAGFVESVFGKVEALQQVNRDHLLAQLKYCQNVQGPWITGFSGIFREWIRKAKDHYLAYSKSYPMVSFKVRKEAMRNRAFQEFLENVRNHPRCNRLGWDTFLKAPITRLQRYSLLLATVHKQTVQDSEEKANLVKAIEEIRAVTKECDRLVDEMGKKVQLQGLQNQLVFRQGSQTKLNLDHLGRELLMEGDLLRMGSKGVRWVDTHAFLFDHYFILAKASSSGSSLTASLSSSGAKDGRDDKKYDVSKEPIPMPLLLLESMNDEPVAKQKGLAAPLGRTTVASASDMRLNKVMSNGSGLSGRPELDPSTTGGSSGSLATRLTAGSMDGSGAGGVGGSEEGKILYPFRVKHLGHEIYTLYASTPQIRLDWCQKIIEAKTRHARALLQQNAEPFRLRVLADGAFAYDSVTAMTKQPVVPIQGTPLDRSIRELEQVLGTGRGPLPVCRASVNCATGFQSYGKSIIAVGTDFGVFISDATNPRGWTRTVQMPKVTQIAVLEAFSVCLVLADKALISYPLDVVAPVSNYPVPGHDSVRRAPQRLAKDVSFFATAQMKGRTLLFYKRKEGLHNTFRVLEPVFQKASEKKARFFGGSRGKGGTTELFRDFDEFYLPTECYSLNLFQTYVAVSTAKGIELLTLDRKQTMSVPRDLTMAATANIAARIRDQRPLGMFRLNDTEFLLAYENCAVYADKHGEVSRTLIMEYSGTQKKARGATMYGQYLLLFNEDCVEVRNAETGRLRQIIAGHDVRCVDYGFRGPTGGDNASATAATTTAEVLANGEEAFKGSVKICMTHPEAAGMQIVLELLLNDGHSEA